MGHNGQLAFDSLFGGFIYGLRGDFTPRDWHVEVTIDYSASVASWLSTHAGNRDCRKHIFTIDAGTGSGKTHAAGHVSSFSLNHGHSRWVIFVVPNKSILRRTREVMREQFGIHLDQFNKGSLRRGVGSMSQGYITTYQQITSNPSLHRKICGPEFLVVFDEVHHLGEKPGWGQAAEEAFGRVRYILCLTGTPYRSDNVKIPYVTYEETECNGILRFKADFTYSLGRAVADGVCRRPAFFYHDATVKIRSPDGEGYRVITFQDTVKDDFLACVRLRGAVSLMSSDREEMLSKSLARIRKAGRKVVIFLGGDSLSDLTATEDAKIHLPDQLQRLGYTAEDYEIVTSDDPEAQNKIAAFGKSDKWILISVAMVSEGTDIPELSAAIFLTSITAKQTTIQRIGRTLRLRGPDDPFKEAWISLFRDRYLYEISDEIEAEVLRESKIAKVKSREGADGDGQEKRSRTEAVGIGDGKLIEIKFGSESYSPEEFEAVQRKLRQELRDLGMPATYVPEFIELKMRRTHGHG